MKAIQITEFGGPEKMSLVDLPEPEPADGQKLVRISRTGVNYADTHATQNEYLAKQELPLIPGSEFVGKTEDGRRVAAVVSNGAYAEAIAVDAASLVPIPEGVDDEQAAGLLLQGLTADGILRISANMQPGESVVINAAAGGTGSLAIQVARSMGAGNIIALASTDEKRKLTLELGADVAIDSRSEDLKAGVIEANGGKPVDVVLEMAGGQAFEDLLRSLAPFGRLVTFGIASRDENTVKTGHLMRNSRAVIGFWMVHLLMQPELARQSIERVLGAAARGELKTVLGGTHAFSDARQVHQDLAARRTIGKILLDPSL
ncbi:MAG: NADPH:quinone oxidoreductase family protein [Thermoleophilia bacterium]|nr:NADPH:quinone oxidoreductase family protein [Thermoleophilia bacterium]